MPLSDGQTFAGYRVLRLLGSGGMGESSRVAPAHCCAGAPSEPSERVAPHSAQASREGVAGSGLLRRRACRLRWQEVCIRRVRFPSGVPPRPWWVR
jgi:hypothetical protein